MEIRRTKDYLAWFSKLRDIKARAKIVQRIDRLQEGNPGDSRSVGSGVVELRISFGPGYRIYYIQRGSLLVLLLCGGDKDTQAKDIQRAKAIAAKPDEEE